MTTPTTEAVASPRPRRKRPGAIGLIRLGLSELLGRRRLTRYLVGADIKRTHADTAFGQLWWVIDPLLQMAIYYVLVTIIFQRPTPDYALFIFAAILPWKWFSTTLNDATLSVTGRQSLIRQLQFPKLVLPSASVIAGTWSFAFGLIALAIVYLFFLDRLTPWVLLIPVIAAVQLLLTMALGILLSSLNAFFRDIQNVLRHALRLWFYLSPGAVLARRDRGRLPDPPRDPAAEPVRRPVRLLSFRHLGQRAGEGRLPAAGAAGLARPHRAVRRLASCSCSSRSSSSSVPNPRSRGSCDASGAYPHRPPANPNAVEIRDLGIRYDLRLTKRTTLKGSLAGMLRRERRP